MGMVQLDGRISLTRNSRDEIVITIRDESSRIDFLRVKLTPENLGLLITNLSEIHCTFTPIGLQNVGKQKIQESRSLTIKASDVKNAYDRDELQDYLRKHAQEDGWALLPHLRPKDSVIYKGDEIILNYGVIKFIEKIN